MQEGLEAFGGEQGQQGLQEIPDKGRWTSLVVQWLGLCFAMQGTQVCSLVPEYPTYSRAFKPGHHNCQAVL